MSGAAVPSHTLFRVGDTDPAELEAFVDQFGPDAKEAYVTTADRLEARGEARGELNGAAKILLEMLTLRFGPLPDHVIGTVRAGSIEQLQGWTADVLAADRLDQIF